MKKILMFIGIIAGLVYTTGCNSKKIEWEENNCTSTNTELLEWVLLAYSDSSKTVKVGESEIFSGKYDSVQAISAGDNAPIYFTAKNYEGEISIYSVDGTLILPEEIGINKIEPLRYSETVPMDYEMFRITGEDGKVGVLSPDMQIVFPMEYDRAFLDEGDNHYSIHEGSPADSLFFVRLTKDDLQGVGSVDGRFYVPMQELDSYDMYRHFYFLNPHCSEAEGLSWEKRIRGHFGDRCDIMGFKVKKNGMLSVYNLQGECIVPHGANDAWAVFQREPSKAKYFKAQYDDNTMAVYDKHGREIIPPHKYNKIICFGQECGNSDYPSGICVSLEVDDDIDAEGLCDYEGNEIIPLLRDCLITDREGEFVVYPPRQPNQDPKSYVYHGYKKYSAGAFAKYRYTPSGQSYGASSGNSESYHSGGSGSQSYRPEYGMRDVWVPCNDCNGSGDCRYCHGKGWDYVTNGRGEIISSQKCIICNGSCRCQTCYGSRGHYEKQQYQIR